MKNSKIKWLISGGIVAVTILSISVYSCEKQESLQYTTVEISEDPLKFITEPGAICSAITKKTVLNAQGRQVADAYLYNDAKNFYLIFAALKGHYLGNAYLHISEKSTDFPLDDQQNVDLEKYEYVIMPGKMAPLRKFRIPIDEISGYNYMSAAVVVCTEQNRPTGENVSWVDGKYLGGEYPAKVFQYTKGICMTDAAESDAAVE